MVGNNVERTTVTRDNLTEMAEVIGEDFMKRETVGPWVRKNRPNTWRNFSAYDIDSPSYALSALARSFPPDPLPQKAWHDIFTIEKKVVAIANSFPNRAVTRLSDGATWRGRALDLITDAELDMPTHIEIARLLVEADDRPAEPILCLMTEAERERALGIEHVLHAVGGLALFDNGDERPEAGIGNAGYQEYQLYVSADLVE